MVTTTLSFAEFLPFWGVRRGGRKTAYPDYGRVMRTVFLDGAVAHTPIRSGPRPGSRRWTTPSPPSAGAPTRTVHRSDPHPGDR